MARDLLVVFKSHLYSLSAPNHYFSELNRVSRNMELRDCQIGTELNHSGGASVELDVNEVPRHTELSRLSCLEIHIEMHPTVGHQLVRSVWLDNQSCCLQRLLVEIERNRLLAYIEQLECLLLARPHYHIPEITDEVSHWQVVDVQYFFLLTLLASSSAFSRTR